MGCWKKVVRCKCCNKIYSDGTPEICEKCGVVLTTTNLLIRTVTDNKYCIITDNAEKVIARRRFLKWVILPDQNK